MSLGRKIPVLSGEASGDRLGAHLVQAIRERAPDTEFHGIGRGWGMEPTTVIGLGGRGIQTMGPASDAYHTFDLLVGYRY